MRVGHTVRANQAVAVEIIVRRVVIVVVAALCIVDDLRIEI